MHCRFDVSYITYSSILATALHGDSASASSWPTVAAPAAAPSRGTGGRSGSAAKAARRAGGHAVAQHRSAGASPG
jgi:hypothetical protein